MVNLLSITKSRLRQKILSYFFTNSSASLYLREVASILREDAGNLSKEFARLEEEGIFTSERKGNQKYFSLNKKHPLHQELKSIVFKTIGAVGSLERVIKKTNGIKLSLIYGSFAAKKEKTLSDIDLLIVGSPDEDKLMADIENAEKALRREINYNIYPSKEFKEKIKRQDSFIKNILKRPKIILKGSLDEI